MISKWRVSALVQHMCGSIDLSYTNMNRGNSNLVSTVVHGSVFRKRNRSQIMQQTKPEEQEKERMFKLKVMKKINKLKFVNGVESHFYYQLIHNDNKLTQFPQSKDKNIVKMHLSNKELVINSYASEIGKVEERVKVDCNVDTNLDISFSSKYMLEALRTFKDEQILILLNGEVKPIVIKSTEDESLIQLILPLKTY